MKYYQLLNSNLIAQVAGPAHTVTNTYATDRNVLTSKENKVDTTTISKYVYTVNSIGQRSNVAQTGTAFTTAKSIAWGYDPLGQVTTADSSENTHDRSYLYDAIGNRQKSADSLTLPATNNYTTNALNQYTQILQNSVNSVISHDDDGNTLTEGNKTHTWDAENRLIQIQIGETEVNYQYDSQSRRIARTEGSDKKLIIYDAWNNIAEFKGNDGVPPLLSKTYTWGLDLSNTLQGAGGVGGLLSVHQHSIDPNNQSQITNNFFPTFDANGNISEYLNTQGEPVAHFEYDPFGNTTVNTDTENNFPYRFSTKPLDLTTNLYYYGYRDYEAPTGRWKSRDPIGERGGLLLNAFVKNDSVNMLDILGLAVMAVDFQLNAGSLPSGEYRNFRDAAKHQTIGGCSENDNCDELLWKASQWSTQALIRRMGDFDPMFQKGGKYADFKKWETHLIQYKEAARHARNCMDILGRKIIQGDCFISSPGWCRHLAEVDGEIKQLDSMGNPPPYDPEEYVVKWDPHWVYDPVVDDWVYVTNVVTDSSVETETAVKVGGTVIAIILIKKGIGMAMLASPAAPIGVGLVLSP